MQTSTITGTIYDIYKEGSQRWKEGRIPQPGDVATFYDGRKYVCVETTNAIPRNTLVASISPLSVVISGDYSAGVSEVDISCQVQLECACGTINISGVLYKVRSASTLSATMYRLKLENALVYDVAGGADVQFMPSRFTGIDIADGGESLLGVLVRDTEDDVTQRVWVQTVGIAAVLSDETSVGTALTVGTNGYAEASDAVTDYQVGRLVSPKTSVEPALVLLDIE